MPEALEALGGADEAARAADVDLALLRNRLALAFGAMVREDIGLADLVSCEVLDHLRDHVTGALNADPIPDPQAEPLDLVAVVERDVGDDHSANADRGKPTHGRQLAGARSEEHTSELQ